jgi:hypothetical protein
MTVVVARAVMASTAASGHGRRGPIGPRGAQGSRGKAGPVGAPADDIGRQAVTVNWQNGASAGRDSASFAVPGIGTGMIVCRRDTQWLRIFPSDPTADTAMSWVESEPGNRISENTAIRTQYTGPDFNAGFNDYNGQQTSEGSMQGIISSRLDRTVDGGPGPPPTTFRVTWHWNFGDGAPRCYVAAVLVSAGSAA